MPLNHVAAGVEIFSNPSLTVMTEDWSDVRSRSRAARRRRLGHRQRIRFQVLPDPRLYVFGGKVVGHPATIALLATAADLEGRL